MQNAAYQAGFQKAVGSPILEIVVMKVPSSQFISGNSWTVRANISFFFTSIP
jgi:hypothetical protein